MKKNYKQAKKTLDFNFKVLSKKDGSDECIIEGYANTSDKDRVGDVVLPSAFEKSLPRYMENSIMLYQHEWSDVAGKILKAEITDKGLFVKGRISDTRADLKTLVREGVLKTFSIGYNELDADFDDGTQTKVVKELELLEISIVSIPANPDAKFTLVENAKDEPAEEAKEESKPKSFKPKNGKGWTPEEADYHQESLIKATKLLKAAAAKINELVASLPEAPTFMDMNKASEVISDANRNIWECQNHLYALEDAKYQGVAPNAPAPAAVPEKSLQVSDDKELNSFIDTVKEASGVDELDFESLIAVTNFYYENGVKEMKLNRKQLIDALKGAVKSVEAPAEPEQKEEVVDAPAEGSVDVMKEVLAKLDMIASACASLLEAGAKEVAEDAVEEPKKEEDEEDKPAEEAAPEKSSEESSEVKDLADMSEDELAAYEAEIDAGLALLEDSE